MEEPDLIRTYLDPLSFVRRRQQEDRLAKTYAARIGRQIMCPFRERGKQTGVMAARRVQLRGVRDSMRPARIREFPRGDPGLHE